MTITCYVVDDESDAIELLKEYISRTPGLLLSGTAQNPLVALNEITGRNAPNLTFVDVDMRQLSGMDLADMVGLYTKVVFTTAFPQFAIQAFEKEAFDYLLKPISYERFLKCVQRAKKRRIQDAGANKLPVNDFFNIKSEIKGRMVRLRFDEVLFVEGMQNYVMINTTGGRHMTYLTMKEMESHLPAQFFARIHRSFIVNVNFVRVIERARVKLQDGVYLAMGDLYKDRFLHMMDQHLVKTSRAS
jgi:DNA-binding LytR/AlgR family response regulator